ncbi:MAG TPA: PD-(D/E)XK nuclease family protein [bacterium]|nr:PD-(D/E)XK nuclease family protein [bacterium]
MAKQGFVWSYSTIDAWRRCPRMFFETTISKRYKRDFVKTPAIERGEKIHGMINRHIELGDALPPALRRVTDIVRKLSTGARVIQTERKLAVTRDWRPTGFFDHDVWGRAVADATFVYETGAVYVDWKTGSWKQDGLQLRLTALVLFPHLSEAVERIRAFYWYTTDDEPSEVEIVTRDDFAKARTDGVPEILRIEDAIRKGDFPPKPGFQCRWCPVKSCPHNGKE